MDYSTIAINEQAGDLGGADMLSYLCMNVFFSTPGRFTPGKEIRYPLYRRLSRPQGRFGRMQKNMPPTELDPCPYVATTLSPQFVYIYVCEYMFIRIVIFNVKFNRNKPNIFDN
jgi:hypothetical protein